MPLRLAVREADMTMLAVPPILNAAKSPLSGARGVDGRLDA